MIRSAALCVLLVVSVVRPAWGATPAWEKLMPAGMPPAARLDPAMAYDAGRDRLVMFGGLFVAGFPYTELADLWEWDFPSSQWIQPTVSASKPSPRRPTALVFDSKRGTILLLGGQAGVNPPVFFNDIWEYDGASGTWSELQPSGAQYPAFGCAKCSAAYDDVRDRLVLVNNTETWEWDRVSWTRKGGPPDSANVMPANVMTLYFDPRSGKTIGLGDDGANSMRIMEWDGAFWSVGASQNTAPTFRRTAAAFDDARRRLVLFGGYTDNPKYPAEGNPSIYWDDLWEWDASSGAWSEIQPAGPKPPPTGQHAMAYDRKRGDVLLYYAVAYPNQIFTPTASSELWRYDVVDLDSGAICAPELPSRCASGRCLGRCCASACSAPMACNPQGQCVLGAPDAGSSPDAPADAAAVSDAGAGVPDAPDSSTDFGFATDAVDGTDAAADLASPGPDGPAGREKPDALADTGSFVQKRAPLYQGLSCSVSSREPIQPLPLALAVIAASWALTFAACRGRRRRGGVTDQTGAGARLPSDHRTGPIRQRTPEAHESSKA